MNKDKKILYILSLITPVLLLLVLFADAKSSKVVTACLLLVLAIPVCLLIKKRTSLSINKKEVLLVVTVVAALYVILLHMSGLVFGYYKNPYFVTTQTFFVTVLPMAAIIVETEIIRRVLLAQKSKLASLSAFIGCVLAEVLAYSNIAGITSFNRFMDLVGLTLFPAISANIYYHYVSKNYGALPNVVFRAISTLYIYFLPTTTAMTDSLMACIKLILPIIMLALISALFTKGKKKALRRGTKISTVGAVLAVAIVVGVAMLISCQFRFGALVVATDSMTGEINKGDMVIYERYEGQSILEGQVVIFTDGPSKIVHRVVRIEQYGSEVRYYTKGDANPTEDSGYRTDADIVGLSDVKVAYVGYPTLWLRQIIKE